MKLVLGAAALDLPQAELAFLVARALHQARSGLFVAPLLAEASLGEFLRGVADALGIGILDSQDEPLGRFGQDVSDWLRQPAHHGVFQEPELRAALASDLLELLASPVSVDAFLAASHFTANRMGLLISGRPLVALRLAAGISRPVSLSKTDPLMPVVGVVHQDLLRHSPDLRDLVTFLFSAEYRRWVA